MGLDRDSIEASEAFHTQWYYLLELAPGLWSPGREQGNIALTRELLRQVDVRGARCLDVGTQEAMVPILLGRRGAGGMVAYDRILRRKQLDLVRDALDADFNYVGDFPRAQLPASTRKGARSMWSSSRASSITCSIRWRDWQSCGAWSETAASW